MGINGSLAYLYGSAITQYSMKKAGMLSREVLYAKKRSKHFNAVHLFSPDTKDVFPESHTKKIFNLHQAGKKDYGNELWGLMTFELWYRAYTKGS